MASNITPSRLCAAGAVALLFAHPASGHHSGSEYDRSRIIEVEGRLVEFAWQNPHVHFTVEALPDAQGKRVVWDIETNSVSILRRTNATPENLHNGDHIKIAGSPSKRAPNRMFATNLLRADGVELVLGASQPRWRTTAMGSKTTWLEGGTATSGGLFHVWGTQLAPGARRLWRESYPLTPAAQKTFAKWDPLHDTVAPGCRPKGMPTIMEQPYPIEFVKKGDSIVLRMEEYDTVRTVYMSANAAFEALPKNRLGRSQGHWEGKTLVVKTDRIDWPYLDSSGVPQSPGSTLLEHFTPSDDGSRLDYTLVVTDPQMFTEPVELKRSWVARPGEAVKPYNCVDTKKPARS